MAAKRRRGVTLLELILALALTVVIVAAIAMAIDLHLRTLDTRRMQVEEAQLARSVLRRIADDLRSAVQYQVIDFSSAEEQAQGAATTTASNAASSMGLDDPSSSLSGLFLEGLESKPASNQNIATSAAPASIPGLYGNKFELTVDISRLPRVEEYQQMTTPVATVDGLAPPVDIPSDVKTVSYYLEADESGQPAPDDQYAADRIQATGSAGRGLVRRQIDRAVSLWATESGETTVSNEGEMLADEIVGLEFRYFDGTEWLEEWSSDERQGLPVAVAIVVQIEGEKKKPPPGSAEQSAVAAGQSDGIPRLVYRLVVPLPAAEPTSADTARFPEESAEGTTDASGNTQQAGADQGTGNAAQNNPGNNAQGGGLGDAGGGGGGRGGQGGGRGGQGGQGQDQGGGRGGQGGGRGGQGGNQEGGGGRGGQGGGRGPGGGGQGGGGGRGGFGGQGGGFGGGQGGGGNFGGGGGGRGGGR